jgi:S1-C subfamily serine protease
MLDDQGKTLQLGVAVSEDGYVLTKASEAPEGRRLRLAWADGQQGMARAVQMDNDLDLLLLKGDRDGVMPLTWQPSAKMQQGEWVVALTQPKVPTLQVRLGCLSARRRTIPGHGAAMGISMEDTRAGDCVRITEVASESPAENAGLQPDDLLLALDGEPVLNMRMIQKSIAQFQPGRVVQLIVKRGAEERQCSLRLASKSKVVSNWDGEDFANGGVSLRTDGFPEVLQHQIPLNPTDMGGPLLNLDGQPVGLNIARVDRVTTFALPMEAFWNQVQQWMVIDRKLR